MLCLDLVLGLARVDQRLDPRLDVRIKPVVARVPVTSEEPDLVFHLPVRVGGYHGANVPVPDPFAQALDLLG